MNIRRGEHGLHSFDVTINKVYIRDARDKDSVPPPSRSLAPLIEGTRGKIIPIISATASREDFPRDLKESSRFESRESS